MATFTDSPQHLLRRNYPLFVIEGGCLFGATYFANHQTVLPSLILEQNGPGWLAALAPSLMTIGMFTVPIFTHRFVERLTHFHAYTNLWVFLQRLAFLIGAVLLFQFAAVPFAVVWILALTPLISGILGGIPLAAWQQLFMSSIPEKRRASNLALRFLTGASIGIAAGKVIEITLEAQPGAIGYAKLHLWAGITAMIGWLAFAFIKEVKEPANSTPQNSQPETSAHEHHANNPSWIQILLDPKLARFWTGLIFMHSIMIIVPFYAVALRERFDQDIGFLGVLSVWQMVGFTSGNICAGFLGDKLSGKWVFRTGLLMMALTLVPGVFLHHLLAVKLAYFGFGFFLIYTIIGKDTYILETAPVRGRALFLSLVSFVTMICMLVFPLISYFMWNSQHNLIAITLPALISLPIGYWLLGKQN